ncbi:MAG: BBP7 family outer membrane beta-barrel protein [Planctomycetales bacterium]|nr:BBP7 family outer membrane beta-barrel protein [Planctomycetales bacterium]
MHRAAGMQSNVWVFSGVILGTLLVGATAVMGQSASPRQQAGRISAAEATELARTNPNLSRASLRSQRQQVSEPTAPAEPGLLADAGRTAGVQPASATMFMEGEVGETIIHDQWDGGPAIGPSQFGGCDDYCGPSCQPRCWPIYGSVGALLMWTNGDHVPALVTTSPAGTPPAQAGSLTNPNTTILAGNEGLGDQIRPGLQVMLGTHLNDCLRLELTYFDLFDREDNFATTSAANAIIARPFLNVAQGIDDHEIIAFNGAEGTLTGSINVDYSSQFRGGSALFKRLIFSTGDGCSFARVNMIAGYRHLRLDESLRVQSSTLAVDPINQLVVANTRFDVTDSFSADNQFNGGDLGLSAEFAGGCYSLELFSRVAIGNTHQNVVIAGQSVTTVPNDPNSPVTRNQGLLAQPTNIGTYTRNELAFVPHLGANLRWDWGCGWQFHAGYEFLFWSDVARPGSQIDLAVNDTQFDGGTLNGAARPRFPFEQGYLWAQGLNLGLDYRY